jgi:hypothetical protein
VDVIDAASVDAGSLVFPVEIGIESLAEGPGLVEVGLAGVELLSVMSDVEDVGPFSPT